MKVRDLASTSRGRLGGGESHVERLKKALFSGDAGAYVVRDMMTRVDSQRGDRISQVIRPENDRA